MQIEQLDAGEELDWLVLHHVFDWKRGIAAFGESPYRCRGQTFDALLPLSTDLALAWRVLDLAVARNLRVTVTGAPVASAAGWEVRIAAPSGETAHAFGETVPVAICRAALRAVEAALLVKSSGDTLN